MQIEDEAQGGTIAPDFNGLRVIAFESRMASETVTLIERFGGRATIAPALREVPLQDNHAALEFAVQLIAGQVDIVIFLTGIGLRELFRVAETRYARERLIEALRDVVTVTRGPKPTAALRELGLEPALTVSEPNTSREILAALSERAPLEGKRIAVQEYGASNRELTAGLEARGANVLAVPVYRWSMPDDRAPLRAAIQSISSGDVEVVLFTSSAQVTNVIQTADADGIGPQMRRRMRQMLVASIGPVCSAALRAHGIEPDLEPDHPKLGHLVKQAADQSAGLLRRKLAVSQQVELSTARVDKVVYQGQAESALLASCPMLLACRRQPVPYTPIWLMRQAGRYMPEYRRIRDKHPFLEMCRRPELTAEVTVTAVERLQVDAAIIFADILLPLLPMDVGLGYEAGDGPLIERPVRTLDDLRKVPPIVPAESLHFVGDAIRIVRRALRAGKPIIGFAGAPFTLASYLVEGGASRQYRATKTLMYTDPATWHQMMEMLAKLTADYLKMQIEAGADIVQLFDSWVGSLGPDDYRRYVLPYTKSVIAAIPARVPLIHFGTITGNLLELMREAGGDVIGLDWRVGLAQAWERLGPDVAVQGNLDPVVLFAEIPEIRRRARAILDQAGGRPGHIFNLGHGILPETPVDHVIALIEAVHEMSDRTNRAQ